MDPISTISTKIIELSIVRLLKALDDDIVDQIQSFGFVKSGDDKIRKIQISLELFNNKRYKIFQGAKLILNGGLELKPIQKYKFLNLYAVDSDGPFHRFILGEKEVKNLNIEFESETPISLENNNNIKILFEIKGNKDPYELEFGVLLSDDTINEIDSSSGSGSPIVFRCDHFNIGEETVSPKNII